MQDLVSIVMPSYNTGRFIAESIRSVIAQTYQQWELIIVDDCSTDDTDAVVKSFHDERIRFYKNEKNSGAAVSRNKALREAKGRWIAFLDSDDLWLPEKLEKQIDFMNKGNYAFSCTARETIDEDSNPLGEVTRSPHHVGKFGMYLYCWPGCLGTMYDASKVGLIQIADLKKNNDYAMWLKVIKKTDFYAMDEVLAQYRVRKQSISHDSLKKLLKSHYDLYRYGDNRCRFFSVLLTIMNVIFGIYKKTIYVKKER